MADAQAIHTSSSRQFALGTSCILPHSYVFISVETSAVRSARRSSFFRDVLVLESRLHSTTDDCAWCSFGRYRTRFYLAGERCT